MPDASSLGADDWIERLVEHRRRTFGAHARQEAVGSMVAVLSALHAGSGTWTWWGSRAPRPGREPLEIVIARHMGLKPVGQSFSPGDLQPIGVDDAKALLAFLVMGGLENIAFARKTPPAPAALLQLLDEGFAELGPRVRCFSNGDYHLAAVAKPRMYAHVPLTEASVDTGVICHNGSAGFAFWVDWDD